MAKFKKGKSGNPSGRPKSDADIQALARTHTVAAIERLVAWMMTDNPKASVSASVAILDRGWGRPAQAVTGPNGAELKAIVSLIHVHEDVTS